MTNKMKIFGLFICNQLAQYVYGDVYANHQEHLNVFTVSAISEAVNTVKCS